MTIDNTTQSVTSTKSGTGWTLDVTLCNLDSSTALKDFIVTFDGVDQSNTNFTKLSKTSLQYTGSSIGSTVVVVYRDTPLDRIQEMVYNDRLQASLWENEFNRVHKLLYDKVVSSRLDSIILSSSPAATSDSLSVPTTAWVRDRIGNWDEDFAINTNKFTVDYSTGDTTIAGFLSVNGTIDANLGLTSDEVINSSNDSNTVPTTAWVRDRIGNWDENFAINTNKFNVTSSSGNTTIAGTLGVTGLITGTAGLVSNETIAQSDDDTTVPTTAWVTDKVSQITKVCDGRLSNRSTDYLLSNISTYANQEHAEAKVYYHRHCGDSIALYDGTNWNLHTIPATPIELSTAGFYDSGVGLPTPYDIFIYNNAGTLTLEATKWASRTARTTALVRQNGILVKSGATTRRYLGTIAVWSDSKIYMRKSQQQSFFSSGFCMLRNVYNQRLEWFYGRNTSVGGTLATLDSSWRTLGALVEVSFINGVFGASYDDVLAFTPSYSIGYKVDTVSFGTSTYILMYLNIWDALSASIVYSGSPAFMMHNTDTVVSPHVSGIAPANSGYNNYQIAYYGQTDGSGSASIITANTYAMMEIPW